MREVDIDYEWQELWWGSDKCDECGLFLHDDDLVLVNLDGDECYCEECANA